MGNHRNRERTCVGCGRKTDKKELFRFVARDEKKILFDLKQQFSGRGGYLCPNETCFLVAAKKRRLAMRLRIDRDLDPTAMIQNVQERISQEINMYRSLTRYFSNKKQTLLAGMSLADLKIILSTLKSQYSTIVGGSSEWPR